MEQAKKRQGIKTDPKYIDRYHGPDDLAQDKNGKLTEIEAKGNNRDSKAVATNTSGEKQSSAAKNLRRAEQMTHPRKRKKLGIPSNRQGGTYTQDEIDLWNEIKTKKGNKRHLSTHTNTKTGRVQVLERDWKGKNPKTIDDFQLEDFDNLKQAIEEAFKK